MSKKVSEFDKYKDVHILCKSQTKMFVYVYRGNQLYWITKDKTLTTDKSKRAFVDTYDKCEKLIDMLYRGEIV